MNENVLIEFGGEYPPKTLVIPNKEVVWIQFISEGWSTYPGFVIELSITGKLSARSAYSQTLHEHVFMSKFKP